MTAALRWRSRKTRPIAYLPIRLPAYQALKADEPDQLPIKDRFDPSAVVGCRQSLYPSSPMRRNHISSGTVTSGGAAASSARIDAHHGQRRRTADTSVTTR